MWIARFLVGCLVTLVTACAAAQPTPAPSADKDPADELPPYISRLTYFGERADWSHDGKRILFVEKTFGDVYEIEPRDEGAAPADRLLPPRRLHPRTLPDQRRHFAIGAGDVRPEEP